jgi:DNA polymerase III alpha subunit
MEIYANQVISSGAVSIKEALNRIGENIVVAGMRHSLRCIRSKSNQVFALLHLEDLEISLQVLISSELYYRHRSILNDAGPFIIKKVMETSPNSKKVFMRAKSIRLVRNNID